MVRVACLLVVALGLFGCDLVFPPSEPGPFTLKVTPTEIVDSIPRQRCVLLVTVTPGKKTDDAADVEDDDDANVDPNAAFDPEVEIVASAEGARVDVENKLIKPGEVAEVTVTPEPLGEDDPPAGDNGRVITVKIEGHRGDLVETTTVPITVTSEETDQVRDTANEMLALFIPWLAEEHPELGITEDTVWKGTIVAPHILVVTHYLFFSDEWEIHIYWHVMIPPYNWAGIELRHRFTETKYSLAFKIPSRTADPLEYEEIEPDNKLWR